MTTFAERLRRLRLEARLSQTELAGDGLSPSYVSLLESGKRSPSPEVAAQLARKLGCSSSLLLDGEPSHAERRIQLALDFGRLALDHGQAGAASDRLLALRAEEGLRPDVVDEVDLLLARAWWTSGELERSLELLVPLFERARSGATHVPLTVVGRMLAWLYVQLGSAHQALEVGEAALTEARARSLDGSDDYFRLAATMMWAHGALGDDAHASQWALRLIREAEASGARGGQAAVYWNAAIIAERQGRVDEALHLCRQAMGHLSELEDGVDLARVRVAAAVILLGAQPPRTDEAVAALERTHDLLADLGSAADLAEWNFARSWAALLQLDAPLAEEAARSAVDRLAALGDAEAPLPGRAHLALADALRAAGDAAGAREHLDRAADLLRRRTVGLSSAHAWRELAERLAHADDHRAAADAFREALTAAGVRDRSASALAAVDELSSRPRSAVESAVESAAGRR